MKDTDICSNLTDAYEHYEYYCKIKTKPIILKECITCKYYLPNKDVSVEWIIKKL